MLNCGGRRNVLLPEFLGCGSRVHNVMGELTVSQTPLVVSPYMTTINVNEHIVLVLYAKLRSSRVPLLGFE